MGGINKSFTVVMAKKKKKNMWRSLLCSLIAQVVLPFVFSLICIFLDYNLIKRLL